MNNRLGARQSFWLRVCLLAQVLLVGTVTAGPLFDTSTPISFFTNVASRLLSSELNVNLSQLQIYPTNQYTPAVHRLLQVTANILDAQNTNFYPSVFRPLFSVDASNNVFIIGYQQVSNVSGTADPQLAPPYPVSELVDFGGNPSPTADGNGPVNVYGVPWVIGAKQGLPNFNQLSLVSAAQITRKLEVTRSSLNPRTASYSTNQMYLMGISNSLGISFWNSYNTAYPRPLTVFASDTLSTTLNNAQYTWTEVTNLVASEFVSSWPGSQWSGVPPSATPQSAAFLPFNWACVFQSPMAYNFNSGRFDPTFQWQTTWPPLPPLPQFELSVTNYLQAFILDGSNVVDYVQLCSPSVSGGLNQALADPNYPAGNGIHYQWSTNAYFPGAPTPWGVINQLVVSGNPTLAPAAGGQWSAASTPMGVFSPQAEAAFFNGFFASSFQFNGQTYVNLDMVMQAPYTPSRTVYVACLLQANDPLVHYLASDLNSQAGALSIWGSRESLENSVWSRSDDPVDQPLPIAPLSPVGGRLQPWGKRGQMALLGVAVDANLYNLAYKDPSVWGSDYWDFPTGQAWSLSWLGQVHRGTPWQTIYLKSTNLLAYCENLGETFQNIGTNTWAAWTADLQQDPQSGQYLDAANSAPITDWQLVSLLAAMLNTNDLDTQFSVNNPNPNAWAAQLDGMTALTNLSWGVISNMIVPQLEAATISSNSAQASIIVNAIQSTKAALPGQTFQGIGDILAVPQLTVQSPFLNLTNPLPILQEYSISDQAYEIIPSQLLPLLRVDSIGTMTSTNGQLQVQFSGYDAHVYAIQLSPDLLNWTSISTNSPINGVINAAIPWVGNAPSQFYRTVLIQ